MHLLITNVRWDASRMAKFHLPKKIVVLDAPDEADKDEDFINSELSDALFDAFDFCPKGFDVKPLLPLKGINLKGALAVMVSPKKPNEWEVRKG